MSQWSFSLQQDLESRNRSHLYQVIDKYFLETERDEKTKR